MAGIDELLLSGERARLVAGQHPMALVRPLAMRALAIAAAMLVARAVRSPLVDQVLTLPPLAELYKDGQPPPVGDWVVKLCGYAALLVLALATLDVLRWRSLRFAVTDLRVLQAMGVLGRSFMESPLDRVNDILVEQDFPGLRLGYGDLVLVRPSEETSHRLRAVSGVRAFHQALHSAREKRIAGLLPAPRPAGPPLPVRDLQAHLRELAAARDQALLSPAEYETKKAELLARL